MTPVWKSAVRRRAAVLCWAAALLAAALVTLRTEFVADMSAFLPNRPSAEQALLLEQLNSGSATRLLLIGIEGGDAAQRAQASQHLAEALRASGQFATVLNGSGRERDLLQTSYFAHRYLLSPAVDAQRFSVEGLRDGIAESLALLGTPAGALIKPVLLRDPTAESLRLLESLGGSAAPRSDHGVWASRSAPRAVLIATTRADGVDLDAQERAMQTVRDAFARESPQLSLLMSGAGTFGVASRATIKGEVERLAVAGTVLMVLLLWFALGKLRGVAIAFVPVASGVLAGIAAVSLGFGSVHGITLGFGTTLIGEAVDYAIYYLIQARPLAANAPLPAATLRDRSAADAREPVERWIAASWPTVRLGLWTSLAGFAALLFSGFGGLAQLGTFSIAGLIAAALTTRYVFPHFAPHGSAGGGMRHWLGNAAQAAARVLSFRVARRAAVLATATALVALWLAPSAWRGDLSSLSAVGTEQLRIDAALRSDLAVAEGGTLVVLSAPSQDEVLESAESAGRQLDALVRDGLLLGYESPARFLPSAAQQLARRAVLPDSATLRGRLAEATAGGPLPAARLGAFVDDVQAARSLPPLDRTALRGTPVEGALDSMLLPATAQRPWRALLSLRGTPQGVPLDRVLAALAGVPGTRVLSVGDELNTMYRRYLREAAWQAGVGASAVLALLALHLRNGRRLLRLAQPIAAAALIVVAGLAAAGAALGILHLVGLLLVVAIGSNYALFFDHLREQELADRDTLASLLLANLTTVMSFGLLAASNIQALRAIGQVVAPGALLCLVLSATFIAPRRS